MIERIKRRNFACVCVHCAAHALRFGAQRKSEGDTLLCCVGDKEKMSSAIWEKQADQLIVELKRRLVNSAQCSTSYSPHF